MAKHVRKLIAPVIITVLLVVYLGVILLQGVSFVGATWQTGVLVIILVGLIGTSIYVLVERIKEIRSGEEDDLSKY